MRFTKYLILLSVLFVAFARAQVTLPFAINKEGLPADTTTIVKSQTNGRITPGYFATSGFQEGDLVPEFWLYDTAGNVCQLSKLLAEGKPVLLIAASYTCPQSRKTIESKLHTLNSKYGKKINIRLIYVIEAHPSQPDICPYTGAVYTTGANLRDSILFRQPITYAERKLMAVNLIHQHEVNVPVLIDSPDNAYWRHFGPAPNNAYLLTPNGVVFKKYAWLDNSNFADNIDALLNDKAAMKLNIEKDVYVEKNDAGASIMHVKERGRYAMLMYNSMGKIVFANSNMTVTEYNLNPINLPKGEYSIVIKKSISDTHCVPYHRN